MARIIAASIDLSKIDRSRIKEGANGAKYYEVSVVVNDQFNQFGQDVAIKEGRTKEERTAKLKDVYIGNGKTVWRSEGEQTTTQPTAPASGGSSSTDDLPF